MSSEGLPVNNVVGTNVELGPRSTANAANVASSSQAADSAAASADRAWKFSNDAAASAAAAKTSETNAAATLTNALSKVVTTEQTVASAVLFNNGTTSLGDSVLQPKTPGANVIIRFKDNDAVEQGAIYNTVATGQVTLRWGGTAYSVLFKPDGTVSFPGKVFTGVSRLLNEATQLSTTPLNTVRDEGTYFQSATSNATTANNYPAGLAGTLEVFNSHAQASGRTGVTQFYYPWNVGNYYYSRVYLALTDTWSEWDIYESRTKSDVRYAQLQGVSKSFADGDAFKAWMKLQNGLTSFRLSSSISGYPAYNPGLIWNTSDTYAMLMPYYSSPEIKCITGNSSGKYQEFFLWTTGNTIVDSNGFIKKASPIVKLFGDGSSELNEQSQCVTTERLAEGVYRVSGVLGFNGDGAWGGAGNGIEIPVDDNKRPILWIESKVLQDGDIEIRTYHRTYDTGPYSTRNIEAMAGGEVYKEKPIYVQMPDGTPIDIPKGRWIDLRVEMPAGDELVEEPVEPEQQTEDEFKPEPLPAEELKE